MSFADSTIPHNFDENHKNSEDKTLNLFSEENIKLYNKFLETNNSLKSKSQLIKCSEVAIFSKEENNVEKLKDYNFHSSETSEAGNLSSEDCNIGEDMSSYSTNLRFYELNQALLNEMEKIKNSNRYDDSVSISPDQQSDVNSVLGDVGVCLSEENDQHDRWLSNDEFASQEADSLLDHNQPCISLVPQQINSIKSENDKNGGCTIIHDNTSIYF